jgi:hypothetical protein
MAPERMMVWVREASSAADAKVIHWFHVPPLKRSDLTGRLQNKQIDDLPTRVGRIWNRLLPLDGGPQAPAQGSLASAMARPVRRSAPNTAALHASRSQAVYEPHRGRFLETVVLFPIFSSDGSLSNESHAFVNRLETTGFIQVDWSDPSE